MKTMGHMHIRDELPRVRMLARKRAQREFREGFIQAFRDAWNTVRSPLFWMAVGAALLYWGTR